MNLTITESEFKKRVWKKIGVEKKNSKKNDGNIYIFKRKHLPFGVPKLSFSVPKLSFSVSTGTMR
jgi:hypothetical protein